MTSLVKRLIIFAGFSEVEQVVSHKNFKVYLIGHIPNVIGVWVVRVAMGWLAWELTESAFWLGAIAAADSLPVLLLGPIGGVLADRLDRRSLSIATQAALCVISVFLALLTMSDLITIWLLFFLALMRGITFAFWQPVRLSLMPTLVPRDEIPIAIALNSSTFNTAQFVGPAVASGLLTLGGPSLAFIFNIFAAGVMVWAFMAIDVPKTKSIKKKRSSIYSEMVDGMRYSLNHSGIAPMLFILLIMGTGIRPLTELMPGFADLVFGLDVGGYSLMVSSGGLGAMCGAIWMLRRGNRGGITGVALRSGLLGGASALLFSLTGWLPLALLCLSLLGFSMTSSGIATQQLIQLNVSDELRGRVLSLFCMIFRAGPALGALFMGWVADFAGLSWPVGIGAAIGLFAYLLVYRRREQISELLEQEKVLLSTSKDSIPFISSEVSPTERVAE